MPLARRTLATAAASISSEKSIVPMTCERLAASVTNGVACLLSSAQLYRRVEESLVRAVDHARPPWPLIHSSCWFSRKRVARAGVLYVWFLRELSIAVGRLKNSGTWRPDAWTRSARSIAAGEKTPIHRPPSEAKDFCGAK